MSDYGGFKAILQEAKETERQAKREPLVACPVCGTQLDTNSAGMKNCPLGHFRAPPAATMGEVG